MDPTATIPASVKTEPRLAAILAADVVGFSAMMETDGKKTLRRLKTLQRDVIQLRLNERNGRLFKTTGDGFLAEFSSVVDAVHCAIEIQETVDAAGPETEALRLRVGVHMGDVFAQDDGDVYGDGVNVAARLEQIAVPGGICISGSVYEQIEPSLSARFKDQGSQQLKNITRHVRVYSTSGIIGAQESPRLADLPSIVALPFANLSSDKEQDYFADGVAEEIIAALSRFKWLFVIGRNSSFVYKGRSVDSRQVGQELGVRYVLGGSIRKAGNRVRVTAQLIDAASGRNAWGHNYDGTLEDIFSFQDQITERIVGTIEPTIRKFEIERAKSKQTSSLRAYDLYLRGLEQYHSNTRAGVEQALVLFKASIVRDENFAEAWATLANCLARQAVDGLTDNIEATLKESCEAALRSVAVDPDNGLVLAAASWILAAIGGRFEQASELASRAADLVPNSAASLALLGWTFVATGDCERALAVLAKSNRLDPISPRYQYSRCAAAAAYLFQERFAESVSVSERITSELPNFRTAKRFLAAALARSGDLKAAKAIVAGLIEDQPSMTVSLVRKFWHARDARMGQIYHGGLLLAGMPE